MTRGLGSLQLEIIDLLRTAEEDDYGPVTFGVIRFFFLYRAVGEEFAKYHLPPTHVRSIKRALKTLVDRGEVRIVGGKGGQLDPYQYALADPDP
jgi:hypothetical protein